MKNISFLFKCNEFQNVSHAHLFEHLFLIRTENFQSTHSLLIHLGEKSKEDFTFVTYSESYVEVTIRNLNEEQLCTVRKESENWFFTEEDFEIEKRVFEIEAAYTDKDFLEKEKQLNNGKDFNCFNVKVLESLKYEDFKSEYINLKPEILIYDNSFEMLSQENYKDLKKVNIQKFKDLRKVELVDCNYDTDLLNLFVNIFNCVDGHSLEASLGFALSFPNIIIKTSSPYFFQKIYMAYLIEKNFEKVFSEMNYSEFSAMRIKYNNKCIQDFDKKQIKKILHKLNKLIV